MEVSQTQASTMSVTQIPESDTELPSAELGINLIHNGEFNDYTEWYAEDNSIFTNDIEYWSVFGNRYNSRACIVGFEDTDVPSDIYGSLTNYLSVRLFEWNSWMKGGVSQCLEVEENNTYRLSYLWQAVIESVRARDDVRYPVSLGVRIYGLDDDLNIQYLNGDAAVIYSHEINWDESRDYFSTSWSKINKDITIPEGIHYIKVEISVSGQSGDDDQGGAGRNDVQMNVAGMSLRKVISYTPSNPDQTEKTNYMEGATSGLTGRFEGLDSQLVKQGWQFWKCPYEFNYDFEEVLFGPAVNETEEWNQIVRLETNESYGYNVFFYNDELYDGNVATFRWDGGFFLNYWYSYPVDLPQAGTYTFTMKAALWNNYNEFRSRDLGMYVKDPGIMSIITSDIGGEYIFPNTSYVFGPNYDAWTTPVAFYPQEGRGKYFALEIGNDRANMRECTTEFVIDKPGRYYISLLGAYALYACTDFSLTLKGDESPDPINPDPVENEHVTLTLIHSGGMNVDVPVAKGKSATVSFNHDSYWEIESLKLNGEDVTSNMEDNRYTTPELSTDSSLESTLRYAGDLTVGPSTGVVDLEGSNISVTILDHKVVISGLNEGDEFTLYNISGHILNSHKASAQTETITLGDGIYIIRINDKAIKINI